MLLFAICLLTIAGSTLVLAGPAWGPGTHIELTLEVLGRLGRRRHRNPRQDLVVRHPQPFLYGNIAADIINFKAYGGIKNHCHNWNIHERLESLAAEDAARAFVLGYLCHLAADIVAHNHFVPYHLVYNFPPLVLGHAYWEAMADSHVTDAEWHTIDGLKRSKAIHAFDRLVYHAVPRKVFGLRSNKWIFNNILLLSCRRRWREVVRRLEAKAQAYPFDPRFHRACTRLSLEHMLAVFYPRRLAVLKTLDPTGRVALRGAKLLRLELIRDLGHRARARDLAREMARAAFGKLG